MIHGSFTAGRKEGSQEAEKQEEVTAMNRLYPAGQCRTIARLILRVLDGSEPGPSPRA